MEDFDVAKIGESCQYVREGKISTFLTEPLTSKQRSIIYDFVRSNYPELDMNPVSISGMREKKIVITLNIDKTDEEVSKISEYQPIKAEAINIFAGYAKVPIPVIDPKYFSYYMNILDKYFGCIEKEKLFKLYIGSKRISEIKNEIGTLLKRIASHIRSHEEYVNFLKMNRHKITDHDGGELLTRNKMYNKTRTNKYFLSIDIRSANYSVLREFCPSLSKMSWREFMSDFTDSEFIIQSKQFREILFGEIGNKSILKYALSFIDHVRKMQLEKYPELKKVFCSEDEIVYEVNHDFDLESFTEYVNELDSQIAPTKVAPASEVYRVEMYKLVQIGQLDYYVREFTDGRKDFKNVPKKFLMQCIKYYEKSEMIELDRKFTDECGMTATYDLPIDFE